MLDFEPIKEIPLAELERASTGDILWSLPERLDILRAKPENRSHCVGANLIRRERKLPASTQVRVNYGHAYWRERNLHICCALDEPTQETAIRFDRIAARFGDVTARLAEIKKLKNQQKWRMRLIYVRTASPNSREEIDVPMPFSDDMAKELQGYSTKEIDQHIKVETSDTPTVVTKKKKYSFYPGTRGKRNKSKRRKSVYNRYQINPAGVK